MVGLRDDRREVLATSVMDAQPQFRYVLPESSIWPFLAAVGIGIGLTGSIVQFSWYYVAPFWAWPESLAGFGREGRWS